MRVLVLGGTVFLGWHVVRTALERGDDVTIFTRGHNAPPPGVTALIGDRDGDLGALATGQWDLVVDTSGFVPRVVAQSAELLQERVGLYAFVSSISVYPLQQDDKSETAPVLQLADPASEDVPADYGALKAVCERTVEGIYGERALQVRSGLIAGPQDPTERVTYWAARGLRGGEVLAGGRPEREVSFIDARDQAAWILEMGDRRQGGTFNVDGPPTAFGHVLEAAGIPDPTWVPDAFLLAQSAHPWTDLPLWLPPEEGSLRAPRDRAVAAGLRCRPISHTLRDLADWVRTRESVPGPQESGGRRRALAGISAEREAELLAAWHRELDG